MEKLTKPTRIGTWDPSFSFLTAGLPLRLRDHNASLYRSNSNVLTFLHYTIYLFTFVTRILCLTQKFLCTHILNIINIRKLQKKFDFFDPLEYFFNFLRAPTRTCSAFLWNVEGLPAIIVYNWLL